MYTPNTMQKNPWETSESYSKRVSESKKAAAAAARMFRVSRDIGTYDGLPAGDAFQMASDAAEFPEVTVTLVPEVTGTNSRAQMRDGLLSHYMDSRMAEATAALQDEISIECGRGKAKFCSALASKMGVKSSDIARSMDDGTGGYVDALYGMYR